MTRRQQQKEAARLYREMVAAVVPCEPPSIRETGKVYRVGISGAKAHRLIEVLYGNGESPSLLRKQQVADDILANYERGTRNPLEELPLCRFPMCGRPVYGMQDMCQACYARERKRAARGESPGEPRFTHRRAGYVPANLPVQPFVCRTAGCRGTKRMGKGLCQRCYSRECYRLQHGLPSALGG